MTANKLPVEKKQELRAEVGGVLQPAGRRKGKAQAASREQVGPETREHLPGSATPTGTAAPTPSAPPVVRTPPPPAAETAAQRRWQQSCPARQRSGSPALMPAAQVVGRPGILRRLLSMAVRVPAAVCSTGRAAGSAAPSPRSASRIAWRRRSLLQAHASS
jgi:hypothetical protein